jgi:hypothetical protein
MQYEVVKHRTEMDPKTMNLGSCCLKVERGDYIKLFN